MEISKPHIARLVLGYLKSENCSNAFNEFLTTSQYLKQHAIFVKNGKYFATRVGGLTLEEIITEYSEISFVIQGKLEQTDYYEQRRNMNLVDQLTYILDHNCQSSNSNLSNDLNATAIESLPGNSSPNNSPKSCSKPTFEGYSPIASEVIENVSEVLSQTLLEKKELHEKLADVINAVQPITDNQDEVLSEGASSALDHKIRVIVEKAEKDPIFDELLKEIIDNKTEANGSNKSKTTMNCTQNNSSSTKITATTKKLSTSPTQPQENKTQTPADLSVIPGPAVVPVSSTSTNSEVIIFNGNLDSYVGTTTVAAAPQASQGQFFMANTTSGGLIMVPSSVIATPNYFIVPGQATSTVAKVLTDTDIMKMPTVLLDEGSAVNKNDQVLLPAKKTCKVIAPKSDDITVATPDGDYYAVYKDDGQVVHSSNSEDLPQVKIPEDKPKTQPRSALRKRLPRQAKMKNLDAKDEKKNPSTPPKQTDVKPDTAKSESHVRNLNFSTPGQKTTEKGASKTPRVKKKRRNSEWDSELREMIVPRTPPSPDTSSDLMDTTCEDREVAEEAKLIEEAFKTPIKERVEVTPDKTIESPVVNIDLTTPKEVITEEKLEEVIPEQASVAVEETVTIEETAVYLRNCNGPPRFKKKCNLSECNVQKYDVEFSVEKVSTKIESVIRPPPPQTSPTDKPVEVLLETPLKDPPKTPGVCQELTPFSKALEEQLKDMDLLAIPTPNIKMTPGFPVTPGGDLNTPCHITRPTDYSTSSSYYQPSDTEQNKSLEAMIEECRQLEKKTLSANASEIKKAFNENAMGKKNLNLMNRRSSSSSSSEETDSSSSSSDSSSESSSDSDSDTEYCPSQVDETPDKKETYGLRKKTPTTKVANEKPKGSSRKTPAKVKSLAEEMEDKRKRMVKTLKNDAKRNLLKTRPPNQPRNKTGKSEKKPPEGLVKEVLSKVVSQVMRSCDVENEITDDDFALHLSTDEDTTNKPNADAVTNRNKEDNVAKSVKQLDKEPTTGLEAEQLVQGLKERGIHLMPKKSPKTDVTPDKPVDNNESPTENKTKESELHESSLDLSRNDLDVTFDIQCFEEEHFKLSLDSNRKRSRKRLYDSVVLEKEMKANVYIESLDMEMERVIRCTNFELLFELSPKKPAAKSRRKLSTASRSTAARKSTKSNVKESLNEPQANAECESKSVERDVSCDGLVKNDCEVPDKKPIDENLQDRVSKLDLRKTEDELMNYAVLGSQRDENSASPKSGDKRKCSFSEGNDGESSGKKYKTEQHQALLKKIDVDMFLNKVHGSSCKP